MERIVAKDTKAPDVGRNIEPASGARENMMTFEAFFAPTSLAPTAVTSQNVSPQLSPAPR